jgi:hypothetical protein
MFIKDKQVMTEYERKNLKEEYFKYNMKFNRFMHSDKCVKDFYVFAGEY